MEITIGTGGDSPTLAGQHGCDGSDTIIEEVTDNGKVLETLRAAGGKGGSSGSVYLSEGFSEVDQNDLDSGFRLISLMPADHAELRDGLVFVLGGGWATYSISKIPQDMVWGFVATATKPASLGPNGFHISLVDPADREVASHAVSIPRTEDDGVIHHSIGVIGAKVEHTGIWKLRARAGDIVLAEYPVAVILAEQDPTTRQTV